MPDSTNEKIEEKVPGVEITKPEPTVVEDDSAKFDDLGYPKDDEPKSEESPKKPEEEAGIEDSATGYGKEPDPVVDEPEAKAEEEAKPKEEGELELNVEGLEEDEVKSIREFSKKHGVTKEVAQALADQRKSENARLDALAEEHSKQLKKAKEQQRAKWHNDLKSDPDFGGEKFAFNIKRNDKVLEQFLPLTKKALTDGGGMLPPYVMRDIAKLADHLYSKENLTHGDPSDHTSKEDSKQSDPLDFYNS